MPAMNILLLDPSEVSSGRALLPARDRRAAHVREVLGKGSGGELRAGVIGAGECRALVGPGAGGALELELGPLAPSAPLPPLWLLLGLPRPIQLARILKDLCSLGVARLLLVRTELGEKSYMEAGIFEGEGIRKALIEGATQAGTSLLPEAKRYWTLARALDDLPLLVDAGPSVAVANDPLVGGRSVGKSSFVERIALDNVEPEGSYSDCAFSGRPIILAVGSERGWSGAERDLLRGAGFTLRSMGTRILKTETAALASCAIALERMGMYRAGGRE